MKQQNKIMDKPPIPKKIITAYEEKKLVVFIGAGVSRIIGTKGWDKLASNLIETCYTSKKKDSESTCINYKEKESLIKEHNNKKIITICYNILRANGLIEKFIEKFNESLKADDELKKRYKIYEELYKMNAIFISTNADKHFDYKFLKENILYNKNDFNLENIETLRLYKIHGTQDNLESLVFTVPKYIKRYNDEKFKSFLEKIFGSKEKQSEYTVLFVGYGMEEFEVIDFLITKYDKSNDDSTDHEIKHYILLPFYKGEENLLEFEKLYYNPMGIEVIGYAKDENGYNQLYEVIKSWNANLNPTTTVLLDDFNEIDNLLGVK